MSSATVLPRRRPRVTGRAIVLLLVVIGLFLAIFAPMRQFLAERGRVAGLEQTVSQLERENEVFRAEIDRFQDPEYIEYRARKCLGMVRRGEIAFVIVPEGGEAALPDC